MNTSKNNNICPIFYNIVPQILSGMSGSHARKPIIGHKLSSHLPAEWLMMPSCVVPESLQSSNSAPFSLLRLTSSLIRILSPASQRRRHPKTDYTKTGRHQLVSRRLNLIAAHDVLKYALLESRTFHLE